MKEYLATFHTHLSALLSCTALKKAGVSARMTPVPRTLSSSCGTCVRYTAEQDHFPLLDQDYECVYILSQQEWALLHANDI